MRPSLLFFLFACPTPLLAQDKHVSPRSVAKQLVESIDNEVSALEDTYRAKLADLDAAYADEVKAVFEDVCGRLEEIQKSVAVDDLDLAVEIRDQAEQIRNRDTKPPRPISKSRPPTDLASTAEAYLARFRIDQSHELGVVHKIAEMFTNREYKWVEGAKGIQGWRFTKHPILEKKTYSIDVKTEGFVLICFSNYEDMANIGALFDDGWTKVADLESEAGPFKIARKWMERGKQSIPIGHPHSGTIVLIPPTTR